MARRDAEAITLAPVQVTTDSSAEGEIDSSAWNGSPGSIEIVLPNQGRVRLTGPVDRQALTDVLAVLTSAQIIAPEASAC